jgi:hypothetical protein
MMATVHPGIPGTQDTCRSTLIFFGVFQEIYAFIISNRQVRDSAGFTPVKISSNSSAVSVIADVDLRIKAILANFLIELLNEAG